MFNIRFEFRIYSPSLDGSFYGGDPISCLTCRSLTEDVFSLQKLTSLINVLLCYLIWETQIRSYVVLFM